MINNNPLLDILKNHHHVNNIGLGRRCLEKNNKGYQKTTIGSFCLHKNEISHNNTAIGFKSLQHSKGKYNTAVGALSAQTLINGEKNVIIGKHADVSDENSINRVVVGQGAIGHQDYSVTLGNKNIKDIFMSQTNNAKVHCGNISFYDNNSKKTYSLPVNDGINGQVLTTDGQGNVNWQTNELKKLDNIDVEELNNKLNNLLFNLLLFNYH